MKQLGARDAALIVMDTKRAPLQLGAAAVYKGEGQSNRPVIERITTHLDGRLHLAPALRRRLIRVPFGLDNPYWIEDPDFTLSHHIEHTSLPAPGDEASLQAVLDRFFGRPLDLDRPLWELLIVEGLGNLAGRDPHDFLLAWKVHAATIDGEAGMGFFSSLHDLTANGEPEPPETAWRSEPVPSLSELLARSSLNSLRDPFRLLRLISQSNEPSGRMAAGLDLPPLRRAGPVPPTPLGGRVSARRTTGMVTMPPRALDAARSAHPAATAQDIVLAAIGGALRRWLLGRSTLPDTSLIALVPLYAEGLEDADTPGVAPVLVKLGTGEAEAGTRLHAIAADTKAARNRLGIAAEMEDPSETLGAPGRFAERATRALVRFSHANALTPLFNTALIDLSGPETALYCAGSPLEALAGVAPVQDGARLVHQVSRYRGGFTIGFTACAELLPDGESYRRYLVEELEALAGMSLSEPSEAIEASVEAAAPHDAPATPAPAAPTGPAASASLPSVSPGRASPARMQTPPLPAGLQHGAANARPGLTRDPSPMSKPKDKKKKTKAEDKAKKAAKKLKKAAHALTLAEAQPSEKPAKKKQKALAKTKAGKAKAEKPKKSKKLVTPAATDGLTPAPAKPAAELAEPNGAKTAVPPTATLTLPEISPTPKSGKKGKAKGARKVAETAKAEKARKTKAKTKPKKAKPMTLVAPTSPMPGEDGRMADLDTKAKRSVVLDKLSRKAAKRAHKARRRMRPEQDAASTPPFLSED